MTITFNPEDYYDLNKSVLICDSLPQADSVGRIVDEMDAFARGLGIDGLNTSVENVVSGGLFGHKSVSRCHLVEIGFGHHHMRMLTSVRMTGKVISLFSYESFYPKPIAQEMDCTGANVVDIIMGSLKRLEDAEFFMTIDQVFDFIHDHAVRTICTHCKVPAHISSARAE